jgi:hypothetical protein
MLEIFSSFSRFLMPVTSFFSVDYSTLLYLPFLADFPMPKDAVAGIELRIVCSI